MPNLELIEYNYVKTWVQLPNKNEFNFMQNILHNLLPTIVQLEIEKSHQVDSSVGNYLSGGNLQISKPTCK